MSSPTKNMKNRSVLSPLMAVAVNALKTDKQTWKSAPSTRTRGEGVRVKGGNTVTERVLDINSPATPNCTVEVPRDIPITLGDERLMLGVGDKDTFHEVVWLNDKFYGVV